MEKILSKCEEEVAENLNRLKEITKLYVELQEAINKVRKISENGLPLPSCKEDLVRSLVENIISKEETKSNSTQRNICDVSENEFKESIDCDNQSVDPESKVTVENCSNEVTDTNDNDTELESSAKDMLLENLLATAGGKKGVKYQVEIASALEKDGTFWVYNKDANFFKEKLEPLSIRLKHSSLNKNLCHVESSFKGLVCAKSQSSGLWLRGLITREISTDKVRVRFVDTGKTEECLVQHLSKVPEELLDIPHMAFHCRLFEQQCEIDYDTRWRFNDLSTKQILNFTVENIVEDESDTFLVGKLETIVEKINIVEEIEKIVNAGKSSEAKKGPGMMSRDIRIQHTNNSDGFTSKTEFISNKSLSSNESEVTSPSSHHSTQSSTQTLAQENHLTPLKIPPIERDESTPIDSINWGDSATPGYEEDVELPLLDEDIFGDSPANSYNEAQLKEKLRESQVGYQDDVTHKTESIKDEIASESRTRNQKVEGLSETASEASSQTMTSAENPLEGMMKEQEAILKEMIDNQPTKASPDAQTRLYQLQLLHQQLYMKYLQESGNTVDARIPPILHQFPQMTSINRPMSYPSQQIPNMYTNHQLHGMQQMPNNPTQIDQQRNFQNSNAMSAMERGNLEARRQPFPEQRDAEYRRIQSINDNIQAQDRLRFQYEEQLKHSQYPQYQGNFQQQHANPQSPVASAFLQNLDVLPNSLKQNQTPTDINSTKNVKPDVLHNLQTSQPTSQIYHHLMNQMPNRLQNQQINTLQNQMPNNLQNHPQGTFQNSMPSNLQHQHSSDLEKTDLHNYSHLQSKLQNHLQNQFQNNVQNPFPSNLQNQLPSNLQSQLQNPDVINFILKKYPDFLQAVHIHQQGSNITNLDQPSNQQQEKVSATEEIRTHHSKDQVDADNETNLTNEQEVNKNLSSAVKLHQKQDPNAKSQNEITESKPIKKSQFDFDIPSFHFLENETDASWRQREIFNLSHPFFKNPKLKFYSVLCVEISPGKFNPNLVQIYKSGMFHFTDNDGQIFADIWKQDFPKALIIKHRYLRADVEWRAGGICVVTSPIEVLRNEYRGHRVYRCSVKFVSTAMIESASSSIRSDRNREVPPERVQYFLDAASSRLRDGGCVNLFAHQFKLFQQANARNLTRPADVPLPPKPIEKSFSLEASENWDDDIDSPRKHATSATAFEKFEENQEPVANEKSSNTETSGKEIATQERDLSPLSKSNDNVSKFNDDYGSCDECEVKDDYEAFGLNKDDE